MDHRLPLILSLATGLGACQPEGETSNAAPVDELTSSTPWVEPRYTFTLDIDGDVENRAAHYLNVVHTTGPSCDPSWRLSVSSSAMSYPTLGMHLSVDAPLAVGVSGGFGDDASPVREGSLFDRQGGETLRQFHSPAWTLTEWGPDTLTVEAEAGSVCFGNNGVDCEPFDRATVKLVSPSMRFEPDESWCNVTGSGDPGDLCFGGAGPTYEDNDAERYTPCP